MVKNGFSTDVCGVILALILQLYFSPVLAENCNETLPITVDNLSGKYLDQRDSFNEHTVFRRDGSFCGQIDEKGAIKWVFEGSWNLVGTRRITEYTFSSLERIPIGTTDQDEILSLGCGILTSRSLLTGNVYHTSKEDNSANASDWKYVGAIEERDRSPGFCYYDDSCIESLSNKNLVVHSKCIPITEIKEILKDQSVLKHVADKLRNNYEPPFYSAYHATINHDFYVNRIAWEVAANSYNGRSATPFMLQINCEKKQILNLSSTSATTESWTAISSNTIPGHLEEILCKDRKYEDTHEQ